MGKVVMGKASMGKDVLMGKEVLMGLSGQGLHGQHLSGQDLNEKGSSLGFGA